MTLTQKIANLTPEQREKLGTVKDEAALNAFATENGIELTDEDKKDALAYFETGVTPMSDDDMDAVAGGGSKNSEAEAKAKKDGRTYNLPGNTGALCNCAHDYKFARYRTTVRVNKISFNEGQEIWVDVYRYDDIKCYKCNGTWSSWEH